MKRVFTLKGKYRAHYQTLLTNVRRPIIVDIKVFPRVSSVILLLFALRISKKKPFQQALAKVTKVYKPLPFSIERLCISCSLALIFIVILLN